MPGMNWPVVAYAPIPATIPNIAIRPLKRSAPEFMIFQNLMLSTKKITASGIPNDLSSKGIIKLKLSIIKAQTIRN